MYIFRALTIRKLYSLYLRELFIFSPIFRYRNSYEYKSSFSFFNHQQNYLFFYIETYNRKDMKIFKNFVLVKIRKYRVIKKYSLKKKDYRWGKIFI